MAEDESGKICMYGKKGKKFTHAQSQTGEQQHHDGGPCGMGIRIFENQYKVEEQMNADLETNN